ncbi:PLP-dependent aminotransferase family protein [Curvibacter sp. APW13]|uniref:MocR-like pyridoxine biosynthesis transcription factor PdxR n=1 Tax=Curvibacter sp. APW13 TaxID=3077236 RepID=UPI0028E09784|nr:PLP-dependent aminotransferase family protein [Curvibacter sp. APW13]MDT8989628.1 PLP-dependent aminotransferase family protein [Curvibacter sp. APW13]
MAEASSAHTALATWLSARLRAQPGQPLGTALAQALRDGVLQGALAGGQRLPSTRWLGERLGVARNTIVAVYAQLTDEGVLVAGLGSGTFVSQALPARVPASPTEVAPHATQAPLLSARGQRYQNHPIHRFWSKEPFCPGGFDASLFPQALWNRLLAQSLRQTDAGLLGAGEPGGAPALRIAIAEHIRTSRGVRCEPRQIIITDGTAQSLELIARLLCDPGDRVWVENPCYWGASQTLSDLGLQLEPLDVDDDGLPLPPSRTALRPRLAYLTPSHQFPTGAVMPLARRLQWLAHAREHGLLLVEDDYDSEYRYTGKPFPSLLGLDNEVDGGEHVLYLGSFSKTMYPGIRVGFMVVPPTLAEVFGQASADFYRDGDQLVQQGLARFMAEGHYATHVRALRREFGARRQALVAALHQHLPQLITPEGPLRLLGGERGVHLTLGLPDAVDDQALALACRAQGVTVVPLSVYCVGNIHCGLVMSFAASPIDQLEALVARMAPALRQCLS